MIRVLQELSLPGGEKNEDGLWYGGVSAALLDGSTSLIPCEVDGALFTASFLEAFAALADRGEGLCACVNGALEAVDRRYGGVFASLDWGYYPSAAGIFVRESGPWLEAIAIGDCSGTFLLRSGVRLTLQDERVKVLDEQVLAYVSDLSRRTGAAPASLVKSPQVREKLIENRRKMNRPSGYRVLAHGMEPCTESEVIRLPAGDVERFALWSDGFDAAAGELLRPEARLTELYARLREEEAQDPDFVRLPRFKPGDDASALIARVI